MGRDLWEALSDVLQLMTNQACPDALHQGDAVAQLRQVATFLRTRQQQQDHNQYVLYNHDATRFLSSYQLMCEWYCHANPTHADVFQVDHTQSEPSQRVQRGLLLRESRRNQSQHSKRNTLRFSDIPRLIEVVLQLNYFTVGHTLFFQCRGAPMGSPCSPALCNMVVAVVEQCWVKSLRSMFVNHKHLHQPTSEQQAIFFATRYVDNRVLLIPQQYISLPPFRELVDPDFYQPPVKLDTEPANIFLGFAIHTSTATLSYDDKLQKADIMHPQSATTSSVLRSSIQARILRARRVCVPSTMADAAASVDPLKMQHSLVCTVFCSALPSCHVIVH
ncbi:unnamed protein product [Symbiodinium natans]|uniref:Uncharacterized protein n=1 Tax=Symbiodinium natans TaxID=878477 RepID=A0A812IIT8_9DINO|nr:unnamed protein product [Symbiodinium natans]